MFYKLAATAALSVPVLGKEGPWKCDNINNKGVDMVAKKCKEIPLWGTIWNNGNSVWKNTDVVEDIVGEDKKSECSDKDEWQCSGPPHGGRKAFHQNFSGKEKSSDGGQHCGSNNKSQCNNIQNVATPTITAFIVDEKTSLANGGQSALVIPGGAYFQVVWEQEGVDIARELNKQGISAFVLKYRVPWAPIDGKGAVQDAQRAIRIIKEGGQQEFGINPEKLGCVGSSAGGNTCARLASTKEALYEAKDDIDKQQSILIDFAVLLYPWNLMGGMKGVFPSGFFKEKYTPEPEHNLKLNANFDNIDGEHPQTLIMHSKDDRLSHWWNSEAYAKELEKSEVTYQTKYYDEGGHGWGVCPETSKEPHCGWVHVMMEFLKNVSGRY